MREVTAAATALSQLQTVADLLAYRLKKFPDAVAFQEQKRCQGGDPQATQTTSGDTSWFPITTAEFGADVMEMARGFISVGLEPGDSVAIMAPTSYQWFVAEMACAYSALVVVPIYETSSQAQVRSILKDADVHAVVTSDGALQELVSDAAAAEGISLLGVWLFEDPALHVPDSAETECLELTREVERRRQGVCGEDLATIVYTSGTTAAPKGVLLTHTDLVEKVRSVAAAFPEVVHSAGSTVILLPLAHILARGLQLCCLYAGMRISHVSKLLEALSALKDLRPTFLVLVPQVMQKIVGAVNKKATQAHIGSVWNRAKKVAIAWGKYLVAVQDNPELEPPSGLAFQHRLFDLTFYRAVRAQMGGKIDYLLSGAAPLDSDVNLLFLGMGIPIVEGYGLTESTAPLTANRVGDLRPGTVGSVMPGVTIRIADDGEVLVKGCGITGGYRNTDYNEEAFEDGFFRTGDIGELDERDHLVLRGRLKDVMVTSYGETVFPEDWENEIENHPLVSYGVMVGESRKYVAGLVFVDQAAVLQWASDRGITLPESARRQPAEGELVVIDLPDLEAEIAKGVEKVNRLYSHAQTVKRFVMLTAQLQPGGELVTPTMKLKRRKVLKLAEPIIEGLYNRG